MSNNLHALYFGATAMLFGAFTAPAQADSLFLACEQDIENICYDVAPGGGRLSACIYANEEKLTNTCRAAFAETGLMISAAFQRISNVRHQCSGDVEKLCSDVEAGQGRIFACLGEKKAELSQGCGEVIDQMKLPE